MKQMGRYAVTELAEGQSEPGSRGRVLRNLIGIKSKREMDEAEGKALVLTVEKLISGYASNHRFKTADLCRMHKDWLGSIYAWAGKYRQVNLAKEGFTFAAAHTVPGLMADFERQCLAVHSPCRTGSGKAISHALAVVHVELLLIHPFREGNGRLARMLATLMALQAQLPLLDFSILRGRKKQEYFIAVQSGLDRNYVPMEKIFDEVIARTLRLSWQSFRSASS